MGLWAAKLARSGPDVMGWVSRLDLGSPIGVLAKIKRDYSFFFGFELIFLCEKKCGTLIKFSLSAFAFQTLILILVSGGGGFS